MLGSHAGVAALAIASIFHSLHRQKKEMASLLPWDRQSLKFAEGT